MKERRNKIELIDLWCLMCKMTTPHKLERREACSGELGIVGICAFCNHVRVLPKSVRFRLPTKEEEERNVRSS